MTGAPRASGLRWAVFPSRVTTFPWYHRPTQKRMTIARSARGENHTTWEAPWEAMMTAARSGPSELPKFPPTWNTDCARPRRPPAAM